MRHVVLDLETDGLLDVVSKIHCLCYHIIETGEVGTLTDYNDIKNFVLQDDIVIVCHNCVRYDIPVLEKILGITISCKLIDTLALSWYLYPTELTVKGELKIRKKHGLEVWGEYFGVPKPKIDDWTNQSLEEYINRCTEDVKINVKLYLMQMDYINKIYAGADTNRIIGYLTYKMICAREQEEVRWKLDKVLCQQTLEKLEPEKLSRFENLANAMPKVIKYRIVKRPKELYKKDGNLSIKGKAWLDLLEESMLDPEWTDDLQIPIGEERGNPDSPLQLKNWLFSLGWKPCTFDYKKNKTTGTTRAIPQVYDDNGVSPSVKVLYEQNPILEELDKLTIITHRIGILKGFLRDVDENGYLRAEVNGFTNTLRFMHKTIVNLPTIHKPYGKEVRGCLTVDSDEYLLCGSDMSSLEDNTKQHYMYYYDPEYVKTMRVPGFSPHLDIGVQGNMISQEDSDFYIWFDSIKGGDKVVEELYHPRVQQKYIDMSDEEKLNTFKKISGVRKDSKQVNFSAVYGVGPPKLSLTTGWAIEKSTNLLKIYWERNWSVKAIARDTKHKTINGQMWLWNPVSQFWYSLRYEKDKFSTLNQGTGVYCFDSWVRNVRKRGVRICGQFHDEIIALLKAKDKDLITVKLKDAIQETNDELKLNIELGISIDFGLNYAEIH